jgi:hypothetical protein
MDRRERAERAGGGGDGRADAPHHGGVHRAVIGGGGGGAEQAEDTERERLATGATVRSPRRRSRRSRGALFVRHHGSRPRRQHP